MPSPITFIITLPQKLHLEEGIVTNRLPMCTIWVYKKVQKGGEMAKTAMTHARLTPEIKEKAEAILKELGISISAAYEMLYRQIIAHQGIPFDLRLPNKDTIRAMQDARHGKGERYDSVEKMFEDLKV
jgi:DNA-damage-inducible protein J